MVKDSTILASSSSLQPVTVAAKSPLESVEKTSLDTLVSPQSTIVTNHISSMVPIATGIKSAASPIVSAPLGAHDTSNIRSTTLVLSKEPTSNQLPPTTLAEQGIRRSSSSKDLGINRFSCLGSSEEDYESDSEEESEPMGLLTPSDKRILRERPVKPSTKAKEMKFHFVLSTCGTRGRGRGGRG